MVPWQNWQTRVWRLKYGLDGGQEMQEMPSKYGVCEGQSDMPCCPLTDCSYRFIHSPSDFPLMSKLGAVAGLV